MPCCTGRWRRIVCTLSMAALLMSGLAFWAVACDTPVYRYAMYRWQPAPYEVYFFHREAADGEDKKVQAAIEAIQRDKKAPANVVYLPVDLNEDKDLVGVPPDVKQAWLAKADRPVPSYMFVSPMGAELYTGRLDSEGLAALIDSPARQKFSKLLEKGNAGVFVLIDGKDSTATDAAEQVLGELILDVEKGKVNLYQGPADAFGDVPDVGPGAEKDAEEKKSEDSADKKTDEPKHEVGLLRISRNDPREAWLVRMLMGVEPDLHEFVDQPMVFAIYGRGRALPPYIGKGISRDNMLECLYFVTGACSCTVKEQNPGIDLLVRYDWETASANMAEKFGSEEGNENKFAAEDLFPELIFTPQDTKNDTKPDGGAAQKPEEDDGTVLAQGDPAPETPDPPASASADTGLVDGFAKHIAPVQKLGRRPGRNEQARYLGNRGCHALATFCRRRN